MRRLAVLIVATGTFAPSYAEVCAEHVDDKKRLACFDAASACALLRSERERLACFDEAYSSNNLIVRGESREDAAPETDNAVDNVFRGQPSDHGEQPAPSRADSGSIEAVIADVRSNALNIDFLTLNNGDVWQEIEDTRIHFKAGTKVKIESGILGSSNLTVEGSNQIVKVKRVNRRKLK